MKPMTQLDLCLVTIAEQVDSARKAAVAAGRTPDEIGALLEDKFDITYYEDEKDD